MDPRRRPAARQPRRGRGPGRHQRPAPGGAAARRHLPRGRRQARGRRRAVAAGLHRRQRTGRARRRGRRHDRGRRRLRRRLPGVLAAAPRAGDRAGRGQPAGRPRGGQGRVRGRDRRAARAGRASRRPGWRTGCSATGRCAAWPRRRRRAASSRSTSSRPSSYAGERATSCSSWCRATGRSPGPSCASCSGSAGCRCPTPRPRWTATGYERGTITPFGSTTAWPVVADERLLGPRDHPRRRRARGRGRAWTPTRRWLPCSATVADVTDPELTVRRPPNSRRR